MDSVQSQLAERDLQRRAAAEPLLYAADHVPLLILVLGLGLGIWLQRQTRLPATAGIVGCLGLAGVTSAMLCHSRTRTRCLRLWVLMAGLGFLGVGMVRMAVAQGLGRHDVRHLLAKGPCLVTLRGLIVRDLHLDDHDWLFRSLRPGPTATSFYLKAFEVQTRRGWEPLQGLLRVRVGEPVEDLQLGDEIQVSAWLDVLQGPTNPGQFDVASYLLDQGVVASANLKSRQGIERVAPTFRGSWTRLTASVRSRTCLALSCHWPDDPRALGLAQALVLGYRRDIHSELTEAFYQTGLLHYVSLSGMHFGILVGIVWFLARIAGLLRPAAGLVCMVAVSVFVFVIPVMAPAMRAAIICWVFCAGVILRRKGHVLNTLALAALLLLLARPGNLFDPSWQLSFACMAGIFVLSGRIEGAIRRKWSLEGWRLTQAPYGDMRQDGSPSGAASWLKRTASAALTLLCVGIGAWLGSAGIVLYHFYNLTPLSVVWTILVFPAVWMVMMLGLAKILISLLVPALCPWVGLSLAASTNVLIWTVERLGRLDVSGMRIGHVCVWPILLYYGLLVTVVIARLRGSILRMTAYAAMAMTVLVWIGWTHWQHTHPSDLIVTCLDVGHGQAVVAHLPGSGAALLLDGGSMAKSDVGTRVINPFLDYSGLSRLHAVAVSHTDVDHINGLPEVVRHCHIRGIYGETTQMRPGTSAGADLLRQFLEQQDHTLQPLEDLASTRSLSGRIDVLWPPSDPCTGPGMASTNNLSGVCLLRCSGRRILFCSDIEQDAQNRLFQLYPDLKVDVLLVPHHGSIKTLAPGFIDRLSPQILICSCSQSQVQEHQVIEPHGSQAAFYTGRDGAITLRVDASGTLRVEGFVKDKK